MSSYIDIHSHILPQIDDGAKNIDMSKKCCVLRSRMASAV